MTTARPVYLLKASGKDITASIAGRLLDLTITDQRGLESDTLEISLDDTDSAIIWPSRGVELQVFIGFTDVAASTPLLAASDIGMTSNGMYDHGKYVVDEIAHDGPPDKLTIRAKAPDLLAKFKGAKTRSFDKTTLGAILRTLASDNKLTAAISSKLSALKVDHLDQTQESDINLLTRLGERYGAAAKIADGKLIFVEAGAATSASGKPLPVMSINRSQVSNHQFTETGRGEYTGVEACWHDVRQAKRKKATATAAKPRKSKKSKSVQPPKLVVTNEEEVAGSADNVKRLKQTFPDEETAKAAAAAEWMRLQRAKQTLELTISMGIPGLKAETRIPVSGFRKTIDGDWVAVEVGHTLSARSGLSTTTRMERPDDYQAGDDN